MTKKKKSATLKDVAKYANVSIKTVSNVVNDWPYVSDATREKVQRAIKEVGYRPNQMARGLITGQTKMVGIIIEDISNPFFGLSMKGCEDVLYEHGYTLFLCSTSGDAKRERYHLDSLIGRAVDGIILWGTRMPRDEVHGRIGDELPVLTVEFHEPPFGENHAIINVDNAGGAEAATTHLIRQGRQHIAHIEGPAGLITAEGRLKGYQHAFEKAGRAIDPNIILEAQPSIRGGYQAALSLLERQRPDAIVCYNDLVAVGAILAARHLGLAVPKDLAVVGFDDITMASMVEPPLTTVRIPQYELGKLSGEVILKRLEQKPAEVQSILYPLELKIRGSCGGRRMTKKQRQHLVENLISHLSVDLLLET